MAKSKKEKQDFLEMFNEVDNTSEEDSKKNGSLDDSLKEEKEDISDFVDQIEDKGKDLGEGKDPSLQLIELPESLISEEQEEQEEEQESIEKASETTRELKIVNGEIQWMLESPSGLYNAFYKDKREFIKYCLENVGGYLPFDKWAKELIDCNVDTTSEVFDSVKYGQQMDEVQQMRQRVKNIQLKCNNQYFLWDRFISLLRGSLARIQYLKPQVKQDGLIYEHMKDIELYFARLKNLFNSGHEVMKTLDGAYETLSRKATITMPLKSGDRYERTNEKDVRESISSFDTLPENFQVEKKSESGEVEWG